MNRIRLLPEQVANQIAAGEVVERPASVVKELVENSLDAGARRISVEIQAGGRSLIRVQDDGLGMNRDDALLCLERHATSKISRAEDLSSIATMGFRGEAIPSIASVSRMTITTREQGQAEEGTQIVIHGGKILEVKAAGCAPGTSMEVRQLFFNLPARRKFMRSEETERAHIQHYLTLAALAHPPVAFTFIQENRTLWQLPALPVSSDPKSGINALKERMRALQGGESQLLPVDFSGSVDGLPFPGDQPAPMRLWGLIGAPGVARATREDQHLFVNRRPIDNRGLNFALLEGYHTALMKGRFPVCCLFLELDPAEVDVNIHPSKREVKFHHESAVRHFVAEAIRQTLVAFHAGPPSAETQPTLPSGSKERLVPEPQAPVTPGEMLLAQTSRSLLHPSPPVLPRQPQGQWQSPEPSAAQPVPSADPVPGEGHRLAQGGPIDKSAPQDQRPADPLPTLPPNVPPLAVPAPPRLPSSPKNESGPAVPLLNVPLRIIGVVGRLYVVLESDRGLVLLDQHAAHERILFEQMLRRLEQGQAPSQRLLLPETIELSPKDAQFLREQLSNLNRLGVSLSEFGERTFLLDALPPFVKTRESRRFVLELIDELKASGDNVNHWRLGEHVVAKTVCRHAVKANDPLAGPELEGLVRDLRLCSMPYTCPHGRPTLIEMNFRELEKKFGRIQG